MTQEYASTKIVTAWHAQAPNSGGKGEDGYSVKYKNGYVSWSPTAAFEESSVALGNISHFPPFLQRLIAEHAILSDKLTKLQDFIDSSDFQIHIDDPDERARLNLQESLMARYAEVLAVRIAVHKEKVVNAPPATITPVIVRYAGKGPHELQEQTVALGDMPESFDLEKVSEAVAAKVGDVVYQEDVYELDGQGSPVVNVGHDGQQVFVIKHHKGTPVIQEPMKFGDEFNFNKND
jgi:hypothetical protein